MPYSPGKLTKHRLLAKKADLVSSLPITRSMTEGNFNSMLARYKKIIVKPSGGKGGDGVMSISALENKKYRVHYGRTQRTLSDISKTYSFVKAQTKGRPHIVQRKIPLAKVNGRPFDVRVMVQRNRQSKWVITGKLAKIAGAGYIITNVARSKGRVSPLSTAIRNSNIRGISLRRIQGRINQTSLKAVKQIQKYYRIRTVGLDIGLDHKGKVWIIEANFAPARFLFRKLKDKSMYRRIIAYDRKRR